MRFEEKNTCSECRKTSTACNDGTLCNIVKQKLKSYGGIRFTADGFDCALPITIDSHSVCSFGCKYCFAQNLMACRHKTNNPVGQTSLKRIENIFSGESQNTEAKLIRKALKYDDLKNGYPCPVQLGGLCDPLDNIERHQGWFLKFVEICKKYNQPVKISTKGNLFLNDDYLDAISDRPELFYVMYSIITIDDKVIKQVEPRAPTATERIQCLENLNKIGVKTALRLRPILPGITDSTANHPFAYKELIQKCAKTGISAISYEVAFTPGRMTNDLRERWEDIEKISGIPIIETYKKQGPNQACQRPSYSYTEPIMKAVYKEAKKYNLDVGISDPVWKQLGECGCCCGLKEDDPVFGNWQRESATNQLLLARDTGKWIGPEDIVPRWADEKLWGEMVNPGVGPKARYKRKHYTWGEDLRKSWNDVKRERGPLQYFQGALIPVHKEGNAIYYKYRGLQSKGKKSPHWKV